MKSLEPDGAASARITGQAFDFLYQTVTLPADTTNVDINFWVTFLTNETRPDYDYFCASLTRTFADPQELLSDENLWLVDLGCIDVFYTDDYEDYWFEVFTSLTPEEVNLLVNTSNH